MPLYEYQCKVCETVFEARQKFSDPPLSECRNCGGAVQKLISQTSFTLKGGGWYQQGYGTQGKPTEKPACATGETKTTGEAKTKEACAGCPKAAVNE